MNETVDNIQQHLTRYACDLGYDDLPADAIDAAKIRVIDTLGALIGGFFGEPSRIARNLAFAAGGAPTTTVFGTQMKTTPDMAAYVNGTTARYAEMNDFYHWRGIYGGHPSDVLMAVFGAAEHAQRSGRQFITGVILAYEVYLRISDVFHNSAGFDITNFSVLGTAVASGKLLGLSPSQISHCISMAAVPNVILRQVRSGSLSMWKAVATGYAGRAGLFAALQAQAGMQGPHLPFEGKAGWCEHVARERFSLSAMGGNGTPFKIQETLIKDRPAAAGTISSILAAEKIARAANPTQIKRVTVEINKTDKDFAGTNELAWNPGTRESADHSIPYVVAATLLDGRLTLRSFDDAHLGNPELRALMQKIRVIENTEFTKSFEAVPAEHYARVTVETSNGGRFTAETGGPLDDLGKPKSNAAIEDKFRRLTEDVFGPKRVRSILDQLWHLEDSKNVATIPQAFELV